METPTLHKKGETLGCGRIGCRKTALGRTILRLHEPLPGSIMGKIYRVRMLISSNADYLSGSSSSLTARHAEIASEAIDILAGRSRKDPGVGSQLLTQVGLNSEHANRYPHEFQEGSSSASACQGWPYSPSSLCDDRCPPWIIRSQIVNMLEDMQQEMGLTYLFIAHDISVVKYISNRIGVMYLGNVVELAESNELYNNPLHPYTKTLMSAVPVPDPKISRERKRIILEGDIPSPMNPPSGCRFHIRCPYAISCCKEEVPALRELSPDHFAACHII